jgi:hypothetical protein
MAPLRGWFEKTLKSPAENGRALCYAALIVAHSARRRSLTIETQSTTDGGHGGFWTGRRLLDFWTYSKKSKSPKVPRHFATENGTKSRETSDETRAPARRCGRLLDRFNWGPPWTRKSQNPLEGGDG